MSDMREPIPTFGEALLEVGEKFDNVVALSADSSKGSGMGPFKERFPERHMEFGIMEQGVIGFASGLATTGKIPFVAAIAPFVTSRPFEMFRNDLGYMRQNVKVVGRCAGFTYADLGATHQSLEDVAIIRTIPGVTIVNPGDPTQIKKAVHSICEHEGPVYLRIGKPKMAVLFGEDLDFKLGKGVLIKEGKDLAVIATGILLEKAIQASDILEEQGISVMLINIHTLKPVDREMLVRAAKETRGIVTVEDHYLAGGLGSIVAEVLSRECPVPVRSIGIDDRFVSTGPFDELLHLYGFEPDQIAATAKDFFLQISK